MTHHLEVLTLGETGTVVGAWCSCGTQIYMASWSLAAAQLAHAFHRRDTATTIEARQQAVADIEAARHG